MALLWSLAAGLVLLIPHRAWSAQAEKPPPLLLEVITNGYSTGQIGEFVESKGMLFARVQELRDLGFIVADETPRVEGDLVALSSLAGLTWKIDRATQTLHVTAPSGLLAPQLLLNPAGRSNVPAESGTGAYLNYDLSMTAASGQEFAAGSLDMRGFSRWGVLSSDFLLYRNEASGEKAGGYQGVRLDTTYTMSDPDSLRRYRLGDFINGGLGWSRPVRLIGGQASEDFSLRPDLVTMPLPLVSGVAEVPSTVDVVINGIKYFSREIKPGPFEIPQLPVLSGANEVSVAVTNPLGVQQTQVLSLYSGADLLAPGLQTFSVEAGAVRRNYGLNSDDYHSMMASATWRRGLSDWFTAESHAELDDNVFMAGGGGVVNLGPVGILNFGAAGSTAYGKAGGLVSLGLIRSASPWTFSAYGTFADSRFRDAAAENEDPVATRKLGVSTGLMLGDYGSVGIAFTSVDRPQSILPGEQAGIEPENAFSMNGVEFLQPALHAKILSGSYTKQFDVVSLYANAFADFSDHITGVLVGLSVPIGARSSIDTSAGFGTGKPYAQLDASQSSVDPGQFGYRLHATQGGIASEFAQAEYKANWADMSGGIDRTGSDVAGRVEVQGAVSLLDDALFASLPIDDAFAVVDTNGISGIRVSRENREIGRTDSSGQILLPDLRSFDVNHISINPNDVPMDATLPDPDRDVRLKDRSGAVIKFPIKLSKAALVRLVRENGAPVELGSTAVLKGTSVTRPVGYDGEVFVESLEPHNELVVDDPRGNRCVADFDYQPTAGTIPTIGAMCRAVPP